MIADEDQEQADDVASVPIPLLQFLVRALLCEPHESPWDVVRRITMGR